MRFYRPSRRCLADRGENRLEQPFDHVQHQPVGQQRFQVTPKNHCRGCIIAGVASSIPKGLPLNFPSAQQAEYLRDEGNRYTYNYYFMDPDQVCSGSNGGSKYSEMGDRIGKLILWLLVFILNLMPEASMNRFRFPIN